MIQSLEPASYPELIFGIAGPIGVDLGKITTVLAEILDTLDYSVSTIKLTKEMEGFGSGKPKGAGEGKFAEYKGKMDYANEIRRDYGSDALARIAVKAIRAERLRLHKEELPHIETPLPEDEKVLEYSPRSKHAYVIRQMKHPDEVALLRKVYGRQFVLISAYSPETRRQKKLLEEIKLSQPTQEPASELEHKANQLIERDASEIGEKLGQQLRDTFHLGDVFIDGDAQEKMKSGLERFLYAFFGKNDITPNRDEYGMYAAKSASLRSADLSRQVGAVIFSPDGELVTQGCNEVPKAGGGTYWDGETPDYRDIKKGFDPNDRQKKEVLRDLVERMREGGHLSEELKQKGPDTAIVEHLISKGTGSEEAGCLSDSWLMDLTEFGRVVHAEMVAVCDAARTGKSVKDATLFCTTFPCHNCTKHLIASGIRRVVYMEPYPKSRAKELHEDEIELETEADEARVSFVPFLGISPFRYRDIFQKGRRKSSAGTASTWLEGVPRPMIDVGFPSYTKTGELWALTVLLGTLDKEPQSETATEWGFTSD